MSGDQVIRIKESNDSLRDNLAPENLFSKEGN